VVKQQIRKKEKKSNLKEVYGITPGKPVGANQEESYFLLKICPKAEKYTGSI